MIAGVDSREGRRRFAAFDIDGTVIRWQLYHAIADELARMGLINVTQYRQVKQARLQWKNRVSQHAFEEYEATLLEVIDTAITSISVNDLEQASHAVLRRYKDQVYIYTRNLIQDLKAKQYLLFALSASQAEIVGPIAEYYGFDDFGGSKYEIDKGHFTGKKSALVSTQKPAHLKTLVKAHNADWSNSIAIGDSESDIPMLSIVEQSIAFNPTAGLYTYAKEHNWLIVVERKNVIYTLEPSNEQYKLKD